MSRMPKLPTCCINLWYSWLRRGVACTGVPNSWETTFTAFPTLHNLRDFLGCPPVDDRVHLWIGSVLVAGWPLWSADKHQCWPKQLIFLVDTNSICSMLCILFKFYHHELWKCTEHQHCLLATWCGCKLKGVIMTHSLILMCRLSFEQLWQIRITQTSSEVLRTFLVNQKNWTVTK
jgi:hypothetical protein